MTVMMMMMTMTMVMTMVMMMLPSCPRLGKRGNSSPSGMFKSSRSSRFEPRNRRNPEESPNHWQTSSLPFKRVARFSPRNHDDTDADGGTDDHDELMLARCWAMTPFNTAFLDLLPVVRIVMNMSTP